MPTYLYWGEDSFALEQAVKTLQTRDLDANWASFNFDKIMPEQSDAVRQALNQAMTPPFGSGNRFVWLAETSLTQRCAEDLWAELERTLPVIPETTTLLLTSTNKPDGRLKSTKLLQKHAQIQEFLPIPPWKTDLIAQQVRQVAQTLGVQLTADAIEVVTEAVGNNTRQLYSELEKIRLLGGKGTKPLTAAAIAPLITASAQNSLHLVAAIRQGQTTVALELIAALRRQNLSPLPIVATLVSQFRQRLWIKLMLETGERDDHTIAKAAELNNPKQLYFLKKELAALSLAQLQQTLPLLLELECRLKRSADETAILQTKVIELCQIFKQR
jgi:DNA polymerase III subunit delta